jgi:hypothetical protein
MMSILETTNGREIIVNDNSGKEIDTSKEILLLHPIVHYFYKDGSKGFATQKIDGGSYD